MKASFSLFIFAFFLGFLGFCFEKDAHGNLVLTDGDIRSALDKFDFLLVKFHAPWCPHCQRLAPVFDEASKMVSKDPLKHVVVASVDVDAQKGSAQLFGVQGVPTVKFFYYGNPKDCKNIQTAEEILECVNKHLETPKPKRKKYERGKKMHIEL